MRLSSPNNKFSKVLCVKSIPSHDAKIMNSTFFNPGIQIGEWYECLLEENIDGIYWIKIGENGLYPYDKECFKTQSQIRDEDLQELLRYFM